MDGISAGVAREVASSVFFPTVVSVTGRSIRFFVPDAFLGGPAKDTWSYVVGVSGANIEIRVDVAAIIGSEGKSPGLMIIPILPGKGFDNFGTNREGDDMQPDLVDIIVPPGTTQEAVLKDYDLMGGRPVALPGVVPADAKASSNCTRRRLTGDCRVLDACLGDRNVVMFRLWGASCLLPSLLEAPDPRSCAGAASRCTRLPDRDAGPGSANTVSDVVAVVA